MAACNSGVLTTRTSAFKTLVKENCSFPFVRRGLCLLLLVKRLLGLDHLIDSTDAYSKKLSFQTVWRYS
jgi:hypothetical protein